MRSVRVALDNRPMVQRTMSINPLQSGPGMTRVEYTGPYTAPMSFIGKKTRTLYSFANSDSNRFQWVADADLPQLLGMSDFRKAKDAVIFQPVVPLPSQIIQPEQPVATEVIRAALEAAAPVAPPTVKEELNAAPRKRGRPRGSKNKAK